MIVQGIDSNSISRPLLVDASGNVYVRGAYPHEIYDLSGVTQWIDNSVVINAESNRKTVGAGKRLFIDNIYLDSVNQAAAAGSTEVRIYNAVPALVFTIFSGVNGNQIYDVNIAYVPPLLLLAGWSVRVFSPAATFVSRVSFHGYEL